MHMIGSIRGEITQKMDKYMIVETGGVGYKVNISPEGMQRAGGVGEETQLVIYTHIREDALELYGFLERTELELFEMLISIPGIGPRSALSILGIAPPEVLRRAVGSGDSTYLTKISGIGKKTAEKIMLELKDKMTQEIDEESMREEMDAIEALQALGYKQAEIRRALKEIPSGTDQSTKIKEALKFLSK